MDFLGDNKDKNAPSPKPEAERPPMAERTESVGSIDVDKGLFTLNEQPNLNRGLSSRKQMKREERKSFHENSENLQRHMTNVNKITSPSPQIRPALINVPELTLEPNESTPTVIAIVGGANSGKSTLAQQFIKEYEAQGKKVSFLKERNFIKPVTIENLEDRVKFLRDVDFDSPQAIEWEYLEQGIILLKHRKPFNTPIYDLHHQKRLEITDKINPSDVIIIEGRLLLSTELIRKHLHFSIYLDTDLDILLSRRIYKSLALKTPLEEVVGRYQRFVKVNHEKYVEPFKSYANVTLINYKGSIIENMKEHGEGDDQNTLLVRMVAFAEPSHFQKSSKQPQLSQTIQIENDSESQESPVKGKSNNPLYT